MSKDARATQLWDSFSASHYMEGEFQAIDPCLTVLTRASSGLKRLGGSRLRGSLDSGNQEDTEGIATVLHACGASRMLTKAWRELT